MPVTIFNSQDTFYKTPFGAVRAGETVAFTLTVPVEFGCTTPYLLFNRDGEQPVPVPRSKNNTSATVWTCSPLRYSRRSQGSISIILTFTPATANYTPGSLARHMLQQATARPGS